MSVNKVQLANGETIIDISDSTVTPETLAEGVTAHDASGQKITGKMAPGGGATVQSDWNQTDETAADFIKNKPFGDVESSTVLYEGTDLTPEFDGVLYAMPLPSDWAYMLDKYYIVVLDGVRYVCNPFTYFGFICIGNTIGTGGEDNGLPFFSISIPGESVFGCFTNFNSVSISSASFEKLNSCYLPTDFPVAVLYCEFDNLGNVYLYKDVALTEKATKGDIKTSFFLVCESDGAAIISFSVPTKFSTAAPYGYVFAGTRPLYTAEYTG